MFKPNQTWWPFSKKKLIKNPIFQQFYCQYNQHYLYLETCDFIKRYFNPQEIITLLTANLYSILFYNSEVWHIPKLKPELEQILLFCSANALKLSQKSPNSFESFIDAHNSCKRARPNQHSILLHKLYNCHCPKMDWVELNFNQTFTSRQTMFESVKSNNYLVGNNLLSSSLAILNLKVPLIDLNISLNCFKVKFK